MKHYYMEQIVWKTKSVGLGKSQDVGDPSLLIAYTMPLSPVDGRVQPFHHVLRLVIPM